MSDGNAVTNPSGAAPDTSKSAPATLATLMANAWAMEIDAAERYSELADAMEVHNNRDVAELFRKMASYEAAHAREILEQMGWTAPPPVAVESWPRGEPPETTPYENVHYLMQPYHALQLALAAEERAERFFAELAAWESDPAVRDAARRLQAEEQEHVRLVREWMQKVPRPDSDWAVDPDPPRYTD
jgi:rubrerythrin